MTKNSRYLLPRPPFVSRQTPHKWPVRRPALLVPLPPRAQGCGSGSGRENGGARSSPRAPLRLGPYAPDAAGGCPPAAPWSATGEACEAIGPLPATPLAAAAP